MRGAPGERCADEPAFQKNGSDDVQPVCLFPLANYFHRGCVHDASTMSWKSRAGRSVRSWLQHTAGETWICFQMRWRVHMLAYIQTWWWRFLLGPLPRNVTMDQAMCKYATCTGASSKSVIPLLLVFYQLSSVAYYSSCSACAAWKNEAVLIDVPSAYFHFRPLPLF